MGEKPKDLVEVVHGRWIVYNNGTFICSNCKKHSSKGNYCPNCGAKMDGGNEDDL